MATLKECLEQLPSDMRMVDVERMRVRTVNDILMYRKMPTEPIYEVSEWKEWKVCICFIKRTMLFF